MLSSIFYLLSTIHNLLSTTQNLLLLRSRKIHLRCLLLFGAGFELGPLLEAHHAGDEDRGESTQFAVVTLHGFVEAPALDSDAVFRALELRLQIEEILIRFKVRILLHNHQEPAQ